jgi:hypothetical protein
VKVLILAAGYATRLRPLTDTIPKPLLPVGGRPMVDWILDHVAETSADGVHLVTNARFAADFERWADGKDVHVHNDGTTSNEDRLGAIGDIAFVGLDDDLLVIGLRREAGAAVVDARGDGGVFLPARARGAGAGVPGGRESARPAGELRRVAAQA